MGYRNAVKNLPWYLVGGLGIVVAVEGMLGAGWWPVNIVAGVFLYEAAYALHTHTEHGERIDGEPSSDSRET